MRKFFTKIIHHMCLRLLANKYFYNCSVCHAELIKYEVDDVVVFRCPNFIDEEGQVQYGRDADGKKRLHDFFEVAKEDLQ